MKTIFVVFTNTAPQKYDKRYCFNTDSNLKVGDIIKSPNYTTNLVVVEILDKQFTYFNRTTGELSNEINSTSDFPILELKVGEQDSSIVYGTLVKN